MSKLQLKPETYALSFGCRVTEICKTAHILDVEKAEHIMHSRHYLYIRRTA